MTERSNTLCERRRRSVGPGQIRLSIDLPLENARVNCLSNGDPDSGAHISTLKTYRFGRGATICAG